MAAKNGRNVSLTDEHEALVERLVASGRYATASEVVRAALRSLERDEHQRLLEKWLAEGLSPEEESQLPAGMLDRARTIVRAKIQEGLDSLRDDTSVDGKSFFAQWRTRIESSRQEKKKRRSA